MSAVRKAAEAALADAARLEATLPGLQLSAKVAAKLGKEIPDTMTLAFQARVEAGFGSSVPKDVADLAAIIGQELIEQFGENMMDFVEGALRQIATNTARAKALRELAAHVLAAEDADKVEALPAPAQESSGESPAVVSSDA